ncbi:MAG TPA: protein kinase [Vicinamibacterales bacterium]|jgi:serine/threonine-protein kinase
METFGRYQLQEKLGQGGMGVVYKAFDTVLERAVALKLMLSAEELDPELRTRLFREARAAGNLKHPNIVTIYDLGEHEGQPYIAMEYLDGEDLQRRLARSDKMRLGYKLDLAIGICNGLSHAHAHGVVHRDIKPANIFITDAGHAKLVDFGLARLMSSQLTRSNMLMGTINYMSPEQVRGERADHRSDIFAVGVMLYELFGGRKAFEGDSVASTLYKILQEVPEPLSNVDPTLPRELTVIIERALAKTPSERYQTMEALGHDLEQYRDHYRASGPSTPVGVTIPAIPAPASPADAARYADSTVVVASLSARPGSGAGTTEKPQSGGRRRPWLVPAVVAIVIATAGSGAWLVLHRSAGSLSPSVEAPAHNAQPAPPATNRSPVAAATPPSVNPPAPSIPPPAAPPHADDSVPERLRAAHQALDVRDYQAALTGAGAVLAVDPRNAEAARIRAAANRGVLAEARDAAAKSSGKNARSKPDETATKSAPHSSSAPIAEPPAGPPSIATMPSVSSGAPVVSPAAPAPTIAAPPFAGPVHTPPASPPPSDAARPAAAEARVAELLDQYRSALESKDLAQLKQIWPSISANEESAIQKEFGIARSIKVGIDNPQITVSGTSGQVNFTRKYTLVTVDGQRLQTTTHAMMDVRKSGNTWAISGIRFSER